MKAAFVFSGQGAQKTGMGKDLYESSSAAAEIFREANRILDWDLMEICFNGPDEKLTESRYCQPAIYTVSMAALAAFQDKFPQVTPVGAAGLSLGEYGALCCAGYMSFADALKTVARRAELMDEACRKTPGTMASIITDGSVTIDKFKAICAEYGMTPGKVAESKQAAGAYSNTPVMESLDSGKVYSFINRIYAAAFGREASEEEAGYWAIPVINGAKSAKQVTKEILTSNEFRAKGIEGEGLIRILYKVYLNREADEEGLAWWMGKLAEGISAEEILDGFAASGEFGNIVNGLR